MDAGMQGSLQLIAMCNDYLGFIRAMTAGVVVNDETLALDMIDELGPTGNYMAHDHTIRHYKDPFYSRLMDKNQHAVWQKRGSSSMEQRAAKLVDEILTKHHPEPLPPETQLEIKKIVEREQAWAERHQ
jgi:trimethylamine--corrinoid protein Co-methyltransferase